jgi:hypothetical protein
MLSDLRLSRRFWSFALLHRMHKPLPLKQNWRTKSLVLAVTYSTSSLCSISAPMGSCSLDHRQTTISLELTAFTLSAFQLPLLRMLLMKRSVRRCHRQGITRLWWGGLERDLQTMSSYVSLQEQQVETGSPMPMSIIGCLFLTTTGATSPLLRCTSWVSSFSALLSNNSSSALP